MDAPGTDARFADRERDHLVRAHHEICTALTVFRSNVELVRIHLRDAALPENGVPVRAYLDELESAVARLHEMANEIKRWHDGMAVPVESEREATDRATPLLRPQP